MKAKLTSALLICSLFVSSISMMAFSTAAAATGQTVYVEDFEDQAGMSVIRGNWYYTAGLTGYGYAVFGDGDWYGHLSMFSYSTEIPATTSDEVSVKFKLSGSPCWDYAGVVTRYDPSTESGVVFYVSQWPRYDSNLYVGFIDIVNGIGVKYADVKTSLIQVGQWYELKVKIEGNTYIGYLDGVEFLRFTPASQYTSGRVGLFSYRGWPTVYDDLKVVIAPTKVQATVDIDPDTLNLKGKGDWITTYIELPEGYAASEIDISSVKLNGTVSAVADLKYGFVKDPQIRDSDGDGLPELMVKFDRAAVQALLAPGNVTLTVTGEVGSAVFEGSDTIRVI
ncbi:MAG: hypothetical protein AB1476_06410 [Candidatus Hadarchaeota archaeon]